MEVAEPPPRQADLRRGRPAKHAEDRRPEEEEPLLLAGPSFPRDRKSGSSTDSFFASASRSSEAWAKPEGVAPKALLGWDFMVMLIFSPVAGGGGAASLSSSAPMRLGGSTLDARAARAVDATCALSG